MCRLFKRIVRGRTQAESSAFFCVTYGSRRITHGVVIFAVIFLFLATLTTNAQVDAPKKPDVHLKGVTVEHVDWAKGTADTRLLMEIENPGPGFNVKDLSYRLRLNDKQAAEGKYDRDIAVPAHASTEFELPCTVDLTALPGVAWRIISGGFDVQYSLETEFRVPILPSLSPRFTRSIEGEFSLIRTVSGWTTKIKEHLSSKE
jgi:LEA14-like dessication related protein